LQAGFQKHLAKPIDPTQLVATVARSIVAQRLENKA
jgi:CheY-like chemotaxis protein